jgi:hypothetical protein
MKTRYRGPLLVATIVFSGGLAMLAGAKLPVAAGASPVTPMGNTECDGNGSWWKTCGCSHGRVLRKPCECVSNKVQCGSCRPTGTICE